MRVHLAANPSHLEAVDAVLEGIVRAKIDHLGADARRRDVTVLPVLIHGDAAFAGEGVVQETFNLSQLQGYRTGGTIHVVVNNQIGFTTAAVGVRSTTYSTDVAKMLQIPIFHVNGDDPEAVRSGGAIGDRFPPASSSEDVVIDMYCYRRRGHNEGDEPATSPSR